jgi:predicted RNase H-like nuclease
MNAENTPWRIGIDGTPGGWVAVAHGPAGLEASWIPEGSLCDWRARCPDAVCCIDVPIGLADGDREADRLARRLIGGAGASVFPAPPRAVLGCLDYAEACTIARATTGKAISRQTFFLLPKIREADQVLGTLGPDALVECHPECSFRVWAGSPLERKKSPAGLAHRRALIEVAFGTGAFETAWRTVARTPTRPDDLADAFACLWTADRFARGVAETHPAEFPLDAVGHPMRIVT